MGRDHLEPVAGTRLGSALSFFLIFAAGIMVGIFAALYWPKVPTSSVLQSDPFPDGHQLREHFTHVFMHTLNSTYFILAADLCWGFILFTRPRAKNTWTCAFLIGFSVPWILFGRTYRWS